MANAEHGLKSSQYRPLPTVTTTSTLSEVLERMRDSEINFSLSHFFDDGYRVALGDAMNGWKAHCLVDSLEQAAAWFEKFVPEVWPNSKFARELKSR